MIINIHGFKGSSNSEKTKILIDTFGKEFVYSPTLPISPKESIELLSDYIHNNKNYPHILLGNSLGGFYAYYLFNKNDLFTFLINPSFEPWNNLSNLLGKHNRFDTNEEFILTDTHIQQLYDINNKITESDNYHSLLNLYIGMNDDIVPNYNIHKKFKYSKTTYTDDNHRMNIDNFIKYVLPDIKSVI